LSIFKRLNEIEAIAFNAGSLKQSLSEQIEERYSLFCTIKSRRINNSEGSFTQLAHSRITRLGKYSECPRKPLIISIATSETSSPDFFNNHPTPDNKLLSPSFIPSIKILFSTLTENRPSPPINSSTLLNKKS